MQPPRSWPAPHGPTSPLDSTPAPGPARAAPDPAASPGRSLLARSMRGLALAGLLGLVACGGGDDRDGDGAGDAIDCAPADPDIRPGAWERCDGVDNDCDGQVDELYDLDGDGFLADDAGCRALGGAVDCNDLDPSVSPEAAEIGNLADDDCDGRVDESPDLDGDGYGALQDCDDDDPFINPGAADICDGVDNDCDGRVDPLYDEDGDGASPCGGDCDDGDPARSGHLPEVCDGVDNDCDGAADEGFDLDGDGYTVCQGDCDDGDPSASPGQVEICGDGVDNDCDPATSESEDLDGDGYTFCGGDCDDGDPTRAPGQAEVCDGVDNDCDGVADEPLACWDCVPWNNYLICRDQVPFVRARTACQGFGGDLAVFGDAAENNAVSSAAWNVQPVSFWIGLTDTAQEGVWRWVDGTVPSFAAWLPGEPNDAGGNEDCVHTNFNNAVGGWNDLPCTTLQPFLCEL